VVAVAEVEAEVVTPMAQITSTSPTNLHSPPCLRRWVVEEATVLVA
jgi:hypothetical protein